MNTLDPHVRDALDRLVGVGPAAPADWPDVRERARRSFRRGRPLAGRLLRGGLGIAGAGAIAALIAVLVIAGPHSNAPTPSSTPDGAAPRRPGSWSAGYTPVRASVVARSPANFYRGVRIGVGSSSGILRHSPVVAAHGGGLALVGVVTAVSSNTADVAFITDGRTEVGASLRRSAGLPGMVRSTSPGSLTISGLTRAAQVRVSEVVVTSGLAIAGAPSAIPRGIEIGTVSSIGASEARTTLKVSLTPSVDPRTLTFLTVLTPERLPAAAKLPSDLPAAAPATAGRFFLSPTTSDLGRAAKRALGSDYRIDLVQALRVVEHGSLHGTDRATGVGVFGDRYGVTRFLAFSRREMQSQGFRSGRAPAGLYWVTTDDARMQSLTLLSSAGVGVRVDHLSLASRIRVSQARLLALAIAAARGLPASNLIG